jgi:2-phosphoglycerate kinase
MSDLAKTVNKLMEFGYSDTEALQLAKEIQENLDGYTKQLTKIEEIRKVVSRVRARN